MNIGRFSVNNPVFVNLLLLLILSVGLVTYYLMPKEVFPLVPLDKITITTIYQDVAPEEVEKTVTIPIENAIKGIDGIKEMTSQSLEGRSLIVLDIEPGRDLKKIAQDVQNEIDRMEDFPEDAEDPIVIDIESEYPVILLSVGGGVDEFVLREIADELEDRILDLPGVSKVTMQGYRDREIWIEVDPHRLYAYGLSVDTVVTLLRMRNFDLPGGTIKGEKEEVLLRTVGEYNSLQEILDTVLLRHPTGKHVYVKDVATVRETFEEEAFFGRMNGNRSINLMTWKRRGADSIEITTAVKRIGEQISGELPPTVKITFSQDSSQWINDRLDTMYQSGKIGLMFVCVILFLFLNAGMAFWTAMGIPAAFLGAVIVMSIFGMSINMITLFSFILALGLVVDDSIVVTENAYRHMLKGASPVEAAVIGTNQVVAPVVSATLTTVSAFLPMLLMKGLMGKFMVSIPLVVTFALISALIECLVILPSHLADFVRLPKRKSARKLEGRVVRYCRNRYVSLLSFCLRNRYGFLVAVLAVGAGLLYYALNYMDFIMIKARDTNAIIIDLETPEGFKLEETGRVLAVLEEKVADLPKEDLSSFSSIVGAQLNYDTGILTSGSNRGQIYAELTDFEVLGRRNGFDVLRDMRQRLKNVSGVQSLTIKEQNWGLPIGAPIEIAVRGKDYEIVYQIAQELKRYLNIINGVKDVKDDYQPGKWEMRVEILGDKAAIYNVDVATIALALRTSIGGTEVSEIRDGKDEIDLIVKLKEQYRTDVDYIKNIKVENAFGRLIPLSNVVNIGWEQGLSTINRKDQRRTITVTAQVDTDVITSSRANGLLLEQFSDLRDTLPGLQSEARW